MKRSILLSFLCALLLFGTQSALADSSNREGYADMRSELFKQLNLTDEQKKVMKQFRKNKTEVQKLGLKIKIERLDLMELIRDEEATEEATLAQIGKVNDLMAEMNTARVKNMLLLKKSLNPDQMRKVMRFMFEMKESWHHDDHRGGGYSRWGGGDSHRSFGGKDHHGSWKDRGKRDFSGSRGPGREATE